MAGTDCGRNPRPTAMRGTSRRARATGAYPARRPGQALAAGFPHARRRRQVAVLLHWRGPDAAADSRMARLCRDGYTDHHLGDLTGEGDAVEEEGGGIPVPVTVVPPRPLHL